ncbi:MAG: pseudouridine synthase [Kiritimatiellae bacterium]|nr:pseudouridine synthase [Kiritimatiellia bacterium]MDD5520675.1 pseudouridine synthase [Kiritimatiellia bacterium]
MQEIPKRSTAPNLSYVTLPHADRPYPSILDFLDRRFSHVGREVWRARLEEGCITDDSGCLVTLDTPYLVNLRLCYRREVGIEPDIPFKEKIVFQNEQLLVACKPHFLPVIPSGPYVNECLLYRLRERTGIEDLVPVNRLDRETAGVVMFSVNKKTRSLYSDLFRFGRIRKVYEAVGILPPEQGNNEWLVESRIVRGDPWFLSRNEAGEPNARTIIKLRETRNGLGYFLLEPLTGKQHQLRLHMTMIGSQIINDFYYPFLCSEPKQGFDKPLQLLAKELSFKDPVSGDELDFLSTRHLEW